MTQTEEGRRPEHRRPFFVRALEAAAPAMLLAVMLLLPFLGKAFTIDDTIFLRMAEHALRDPLHPSAFEMVWSEIAAPMRLSQIAPNGPVGAWLLVPALLAGGSEIVAHLMQMLLLVIAVFETAMLALRCGFDQGIARLAALLLATTPAALAMAGTAMPDIAAMTLALVGVERLLAWKADGGAGAALVAAVALGLAPLARSHALLIFLLAPLLLDDPRVAAARRQWLPVLAGALVTALLLVVTRDPLGSSGDFVRAAGVFSGTDNLRSNLLAVGTHWMLVMPLGFAVCLSRAAAFWLSPLPWLGMLAAAAAFWLGGESAWLPLAPVTGLGFGVLAHELREAFAARDTMRPALAAWLLLPLPILVYLHFPSKYLLVAAPAAAILAARSVCSLPRGSSFALSAALVLAGAGNGTMILRADEAFAGLGRRAVETLVVPHLRAGDRVWFNAHWGLQWYAERAGAKALTITEPRPQVGDLLLTSTRTITGPLAEGFGERHRIEMLSDETPGGRIAGFYSNGWGYLPWTWGSDEIDRFELWRLW